MAGIYHQRHLERTVFYRVMFHDFEEFVAEYENHFEREYGYFRPVIKEVVEKYLDCRNPKCGFARIRCGDCGKEFLLTFSCKVLGFCPSCHAKRGEEWGEWMRDELLLDVPHRQVVFTIPKMLRIFFKYKRSLLSGLCLCRKWAILKYLRAVTGKEITPGIIAVIQSFGSKINLHPHLHFLLTEGGEAQEGQFRKLSFFDESLIAKFFSRELFSMLLHQGLINLELVQKILRWRHTGFNVHTKVRTTTKRETERVGKYMIRPLLSLKRLSIDKVEGKVCYQYGKDSSELERMDYLEFIARVTSHIPDKGQVMIRYYGLYANAHRGKMSRAGVSPSHPPIIKEEERFMPSKGWAEMIRKVYEVDPLLCLPCGGQMSIIAFIKDHKVIDKIIRLLKLTFYAERPPPPHVFHQELLLAAEERGIFLSIGNRVIHN